MRGAVFCMPASGHLNPLLALVAELVRRGEALDFYGAEDSRGLVEATGARFRPLAGVERFHTLDPEQGMFALGEIMSSITLEVLPAIEAALEGQRPDYVLYDAMTPWGRRAAEVCRLPAVVTYASFATVPERSLLPPLPILFVAMGPANLPRNLQRYRARSRLERQTAERYGVPPLLRFTHVISNPSACNVVFTSDAFQVKRDRLDARFHFVGPCIARRAPDPTFPLGALSGRPVVYASLGTVFHQDLGFYRACVQAFAGQGYTLVLSVGARTDPAALGPLPPDCIVRQRVPQLEVLERASLFVTHGGMNSVGESLVHGVPMLVAPQAADQFLVARRVEELGLGRRLRGADQAPERLRALARTTLADAGIKDRVREHGASLRAAGGAARAADVVLEHVGRRPVAASAPSVPAAAPPPA